MARKRSMKTAPEAGRVAQLRHVLVVGGTVAQWDAFGADRWATRRNELAKAVAHAGAMWLTLRPYEQGPSEHGSSEQRLSERGLSERGLSGQRSSDQRDASSDPTAMRTERLVDVREGCTVIVDPAADGRRRLLWAIEQLKESRVTAADESALSGVLMSPAPIEPDLTIVLGPVTRLPPSLVWELAYSEIVFIDTAWDELAASHVERATDEFSRRHRRFGGIE